MELQLKWTKKHPTHRFFQIAIWLPFIGLLIILLGDWIYQRYDISTEQIALIYWLGFGVVAYPVFAIWANRYIKNKSESAIARLIWWAPIIFIPFYGVPWVLYGFSHIVMGDMSGIAMALSWIAFLPYIIVVGYVFAAVSFVIYEMFFRSISIDHDFVCAVPDSTQNMAGNIEFFGNSVEREGFVGSEDKFAFYPRKTFLGQQGLFTYHATLMITDSELDSFFELAGKVFGQTTIKQGSETIYSSSDGPTLQLSVRQEFNGLIIELVTNSKILLEGLDALFKAPPPPWFAFPKMEPIEATMNKQGSLEYWWNWFWNPFWQHASAQARANYLRDHKASDEWTECLAPTDQG